MFIILSCLESFASMFCRERFHQAPTQRRRIPMYTAFTSAGVIKKVSEAAVAGATTIDLCKLGDSLILAETNAVYTKKVNGEFVVPKGKPLPARCTCPSVL